MVRAKPAEIRRIAVVGGGVIGSGWAARFAARGIDVVVTDPAPGAEERLRDNVANAWPALQRVGVAPGADPTHIEFTDDLEAAVGGADYVQECAPENEAVKRALFARMDDVARPEVVLASSSSGLMPTAIQADCATPERVVIGHPFNPVYLLPLCEVLGGERTAADAVDAAFDFYAHIGMRPLRVRKEMPGYVSDRMQEAMWREVLHIVAEGGATTEEIDAAIADGPGLRLANFGPCLTFYLAGGTGGLEHYFEQFGPAMKEQSWTQHQPPELTEELIEGMIAGTDAQAAGRSIRDLERERDNLLIDTMRLRDEYRAGLGAHAGDRYARRDVAPWRAGDAVAAPLALFASVVEPAWVDYNRHMSEGFYLYAFGEASDALFRYIGVDEGYRAAGHSFYTAESHLNFYREAAEGEPLRFTTQLLGLDDKRVHIFHAMYHGGDDGLLATTEQMLLHVDTAGPKTSPILPEVRAALDAIMAAHADLAVPEQVGGRMAIPGAA